MKWVAVCMVRRDGPVFVCRHIRMLFYLQLFLRSSYFSLVCCFQHQLPIDMVKFWGEGFWKLLAFAMQMVLVLVTGHTLAKTRVVESILKGISTILGTSPCLALPGLAFVISWAIVLWHFYGAEL